MYDLPQFGWNKTSDAVLCRKFHVLCGDRLRQWVGQYFASDYPARYYAKRIRRNARERGDDHAFTRVERVSAYAAGEVRLARGNDDRGADLNDECIMDAVVGRN